MTVYRSDSSRSTAWHFKRVLAFMLVCLLLNGALFASIYRHWKIQEILETRDSEGVFFVRHEQENVTSREVRSPAWILIEETRLAIKEAGGVPGTVLSTKERRAWDTAHPCAGRHHLLGLWSREKKKPSPVINKTVTAEPSVLLQVLFEEYANLHRTCTRGGDVEYVTELYNSRNESSPCKFLVVEFGTYGVGNRLLWLVSAYQYALLSQRVLLIDTRSTVHTFLCEPFPGSSWHLPDNFPYSSERRWPMPNDFQKAWDAWENKRIINSSDVRKKPVDEKIREHEGLRELDMHVIEREKRETMAFIRSKIRAKVDSDGLSSTDEEIIRKLVDVERLTDEDHPGNLRPNFHQVQANDGWAPNPRFFCDNEQERLQAVKWVSLNSGCLYFLPDLFAVSSFQPALEELFPDRDPLTHLLRQLTLPVDSIWTKVRKLYTTVFQSASRVVGMQVRYRDGAAMYKILNFEVNNRISRCAQDHGLIPDPAPSATSRSTLSNHDGPVVIFVASLYPGLRDHLQSVYEAKTTRRGSRAVTLIQLSKLGFQSFETDADHQAFIEIICLSLSDEIMTSPQSTYGQMAQAYGGLTPWLIDFNPQEPGNCVRGQSTDACYQLAIAKFTCPFNKEVDGMAMAAVAPYLKPCQDTDGLQLVPQWSLSLLPP